MHGLLRGDGTELPVQGGHRARDLCRPAYGWFPTRKYTGPMSMAAVVLVVLAAGIALAPIAHADSQSDQKVIAYLDSHGLSAKSTDMNVGVPSAHMACSELAAGKSEVAVELDVVGQNGNLSRADASWVIAWREAGVLPVISKNLATPAFHPGYRCRWGCFLR